MLFDRVDTCMDDQHEVSHVVGLGGAGWHRGNSPRLPCTNVRRSCPKWAELVLVHDPWARQVSRNSRELLRSIKPFVKLPPAFFKKLVFHHIYKLTGFKVIAKFDDLTPLCF